LFDYFDPLLSPHSYPNGIAPNQKPVDKEEYDPLRLKHLNVLEEEAEERPALEELEYGPEVDTDLFFDPTLSPHAYAQGTPRAVVGDEEYRGPTVGILLIDHGSRNQAANQRLVEMAALYQQSVSSVLVEAAHMELACPSIQEGIERLVSKGVVEIVCHPYFLSPDGRHVAEDIPRLVHDAVQALQVEIPVRTTEAVGSDMLAMLGAIHTLVKETSTLLGTSRNDRF
jgi:hypothetical protein